MTHPKRRFWGGLCVYFLLAVSAFAPASADDLDFSERLKPETFTLRNGMQVVVIPDHRVPVVTHMVWIKIGAADEAVGRSGLAHLLEHLMSSGTKKLKPREFSQIVARNGGLRNAFTSYDYTGYFQRIALDRLPLMMEMQADLMANLTMSEDKVASEKQVVLEERSFRVENNPAAILNNEVNAALFRNQHYGLPVIGWRHEIEGLTREDALNWYRTYYAPNNAILVVAGDITAEELKPLARKYYGKLKRRKVPERIRANEAEPLAAVRIEMKDVRVKQPSFQRAYLAPSARTGEPREAEALEVLAYILGGSNNSHLYKQLVINDRVAAAVRVFYGSTAVNDTDLTISATPSQTADLEALERAIDSEVARLLSEGVSEEEVAKAIKTLKGDAIYALDSQSNLANLFGRELATGGTIDDVLQWPQRLSAVTAQDVNAVARKVIQPHRSVTGLLLPEEAAQ
ncbi:MAG: insulinase family protein [Alphaproteobacteria bacterium]|nr:MAG: insulinase family protein [Alphaproteobacteria bacterium]